MIIMLKLNKLEILNIWDIFLMKKNIIINKAND